MRLPTLLFKLLCRADDDEYRRDLIGVGIAEAYLRQPQTDEELTGLDRATSALVDEERW